jgi:hypothetical protein
MQVNDPQSNHVQKHTDTNSYSNRHGISLLLLIGQPADQQGRDNPAYPFQHQVCKPNLVKLMKIRAVQRRECICKTCNPHPPIKRCRLDPKIPWRNFAKISRARMNCAYQITTTSPQRTNRRRTRRRLVHPGSNRNCMRDHNSTERKFTRVRVLRREGVTLPAPARDEAGTDELGFASAGSEGWKPGVVEGGRGGSFRGVKRALSIPLVN